MISDCDLWVQTFLTFLTCYLLISLVIWQKGKFQKGCSKNTKLTKFSKKRTFFTPWYGKRANLKTEVIRIQSMPNFPKNEWFLPPDRHTYVCLSGGKNRSFFGKFNVLCILVTSVLRFTLLPYYWWFRVTGFVIVGGEYECAFW